MKNIISIIVIVVSLASFVLVVKPGYAEIKNIKIKSQELELVLVNARKLQSLRDDLLSKKKNLAKNDLSRLEKLIPEGADNVKLIIDFQNIADKYNLQIQAASADKDTNSDTTTNNTFDIQTQDYGVISLDFTLSGGYSEFISFLKEVEDNLRITDLRSLSITPKENGLFDYVLKVETYWLKDNI